MTRPTPPDTTLREEPGPRDLVAVRELVAATGFFTPAEIEVAEELVRERLQRGVASGYFFLLADDDEGLAGYSCYGPIEATVDSWDLYWIAVHPRRRDQGLGTILLRETERRVATAGGRRVWVETSSRDLYVPTRAFYVRRGYAEVARLPDFYAPGDSKVILGRDLSLG
jgi:ribosomal protein S18 acetylase RimI-like enzyme